MAARKSMANMLMDNAMQSPPISSPLRRKTIFMHKPGESSALSENDDEAERLARRREIKATSTPLNAISTNDRRRSLGLSFLVNMPAAQMADRVSQCIKLSAENKINLKNAFSLEMIDFMTYMIKRKDDNMSNLQVASTSLDVSTKIYGFRVDGVHMETLRMLGGLDKQLDKDKEDKNENNAEEPMDVETEDVNDQLKEQKKKKKKKSKQRIFNTVEALRMNVETEKPSIITLEADSQSTDMLYQAVLPNHANSGFYQHLYNDVLVDVVECKDVQYKDVNCIIPNTGDFSDMSICPPLVYFDFQSWNADDEPEEVVPEENNETRFEFDLDASLPNDEPEHSAMCYFDIDDNEEENVYKCTRAPNEAENIVDFREVLSTTVSKKGSEYSFIEKNLSIHWAGPSHWKFPNFKKMLGNSKVVETCRQAPKRKKKEVELHYDDEAIENIHDKFLPALSVKLQARTAKMEWNEELLMLPPDEHFDINIVYKLYSHSTILKHSVNVDDINATHLSNSEDNYNYDNDNDISNYCPNINNDEECQNIEVNNTIENGAKFDDEGVLGSQMPFTGDNLVAIPKLTNKSNIAYCVRAKKIDMRQLKKALWKCLTIDKENNKSIQNQVQQAIQQKETMDHSVHFSDVYKKLPNELTKTNVEALSFPISFVSLLHLANEKVLKVTSTSDMSDLVVEQG
ncbi:condensin complex subunit 2 [Calliopsis andreniformis]|uniref:condensin complex subunit 2 n=1 Tax=Calliopsis andreniformis TaxID=337506 RepID=UPI003FCD920A